MAIITQTSRILIREFLPEEGNLFLTLLSDERLTPYLPKRNAEENRKIFRDTLAEYEAGIKLTRWGIFDKRNGGFIGLSLLKYVENEPYHAELGYVIHEIYKGTGLATELSEALIKYGFADMKLSEIYAVTDKANAASQRVLVKAGLVQGNDIMRNGDWLSYFSITSGEQPR